MHQVAPSGASPCPYCPAILLLDPNWPTWKGTAAELIQKPNDPLTCMIAGIPYPDKAPWASQSYPAKSQNVLWFSLLPTLAGKAFSTSVQTYILSLYHAHFPFKVTALENITNLLFSYIHDNIDTYLGGVSDLHWQSSFQISCILDDIFSILSRIPALRLNSHELNWAQL